MKKEIIQKIELLVEMSGTTNTYETLNEELIALNQEIESQKKIVQDLKKSMSDNKYLKANERIIDENIKIGIENRIQSYQSDLKDLEQQIEDISFEEENVHTSITSLEQENKQLKSFLSSLELKMKTIGEKSEDVYPFYDSLMSKTTEDIKKVESELENKEKCYHRITLKMENIGEIRTNLEEELAKETNRLTEVETTLASPNSYVNYKAKKEDEDNIDRFIAELEALEHKHLEILTDPAYIGEEAKELYLADDKTSALDKLKELVTIVNSKPFMTTPYSDLGELLENVVNKRDEIENNIENKSYEDEDSSVMNIRLLYLEERKEKKNSVLASLQKTITETDLQTVKDLVQKIEEVKEVRDHLKTAIESYKKVLGENDDQKTPKKKASLKAALKKKMDELVHVEEVLNAFETDLENTVIESKKMEEEDVVALQNEINEYTKEIAEINKQKMMKTNSKDVLSLEKDKDLLRKISDDVQSITNRQKYNFGASEILDQIELSFGTEEVTISEEPVNNDFINLEDYRIDPSPITEEVLEETLSTPKEETIPEAIDLTDNFEDIFTALDLNEKQEEDFPPRQEKNLDEKRMKVVKVEPIEEEKKIIEPKEPIPDEDILINDFEDTDYISFNDLLEDDSHAN